MKRITVILSDKAAAYLAELQYSLTMPPDDKPATISECINSSLESLAEFEKKTDNQLWNWLSESPSPVDAVEAVDPVALLDWIWREGYSPSPKGGFYKDEDLKANRIWGSELLDLYKQSFLTPNHQSNG